MKAREEKLWSWHERSRPKTFNTALNRLFLKSGYTLTERALAIAAGVSRASVHEWLEGRSIPSDAELFAVAGAFCLNRYSRVNCTQRDRIFFELQAIANYERRIIEAQRKDEER